MTERRHAPDAVDATGKLFADCYCPRCDHFSGGGLCRICKREVAIEERDGVARDTGPEPQAEPTAGQQELL